MPLIKIIKDGRELVLPERLAEKLIEGFEAEFIDVVPTKAEVIAKHKEEKRKALEQAKIERQRQSKERQEAIKNERLERIARTQLENLKEG
jgi:cell division protein FtsN